jgi:hypothetical protein
VGAMVWTALSGFDLRICVTVVISVPPSDNPTLRPRPARLKGIARCGHGVPRVGYR